MRKNSSKRRIIIKKALLWFLVVLMVVITTGGTVFAQTVIKINNAEQMVDEAIWAQMVANTMLNCVDAIDNDGVAENGNIFSGYNLARRSETQSREVGTRIEEAVTGSANDGNMYCDEGKGELLRLFAKTLGVTVEQVVCNKDEPWKPGLLQVDRENLIDDPEELKTLNCLEAFKGNDFWSYNYGSKIVSYDGRSYLKELYEEAGKDNPYWEFSSNIETFTGARRYGTLLMDFKKYCNIAPDTTGGQGGHFVTVVEIDDNGQPKEVSYRYDANETSVSVTGNLRTCKDLAELVKSSSGDAGPYKNMLNTAFSIECNSSDEVKKAWEEKLSWAREVLRNKENYSEENVKTAQEIQDAYLALPEEEILNEYNEPETIKKYWGEKDGLMQCLVPDGYEVAIEEYQEQDPESQRDSCYDSAGSTGWIACPAIYGMADATDGISTFLDKWLSVDTSLYDNNSDTYTAWGYFRDFSNVLMIIIILVIVFSQLTGVGIDNYGIKKMLPKLILMAILINLSYVICQILIDLSNILGVNLNDLFQSIGRTVRGDEFNLGSVTAGMVATLFAAVGATGAATSAVLPIVIAGIGGGMGPMVIISLILTLLTALVAVLFFFLAIGARMIIIILFTAIAPLAFACYILPNTQNLFKKWLNVYKAALLVYPICGALYGLSFVIRGIIFGGNGEVSFAMALIGVCAPFIPFLALPALLKGAMAGLGAIGGALTSLKNGLTSGIRKGNSAVQGTDQFRKSQERGKARVGAWSAKRFRDRMDKRIDNGISDPKKRTRLQSLRNKVRSGNATESEKKEFKKLQQSSNFKLSRGQTGRLADANAAINAYESGREKDEYGANDLVAAGNRQSDSYKNASAAEEAMGWTDGFYRDNDGNVWVSDGNGKYSTIDKDGKRQTKSSAWVEQNTKRMSRREAMLNQDAINRAKQTGQLAGYANASRVAAAERGARLSAVESSQAGLIDTAQSGQDDVLQIQHDSNATKRRELAGKAEAAAAFRAQGLDTVISKSAAEQAAEAQLTNVAAQNLAADDYANKVKVGSYDEAKIRDDAVLAGAIKNVNQKTETVAKNDVGEVVVDIDVSRKNAQSEYNLANAKNNIDVVSEITQDYAESLVKERFNTAQEKMYSEQLSNNNRAKSLSDLAGAIAGASVSIGTITGSSDGGGHVGDTNYIMAALKDVVSKGGIEDVNNLIKSGSATIGGDPNVAKMVYGYMATISAEPVMKVYGKYASNEIAGGGTPVDYNTWLNATDAGETSDPDGKLSLAGFIRANGDTVLTNSSKDTFKFYTGDPALVSKFSPKQVLNGALSAKDNETRVAANNMLKERVTSESDLKEAVNGISISQWANMEESTFNVLLNGRTFSGLSPSLQNAFREVKKRLDASSGTVKANMRSGVRDFFNSIS